MNSLNGLSSTSFCRYNRGAGIISVSFSLLNRVLPPALSLKELLDLTHTLHAWLVIPAALLTLASLPIASQAQRTSNSPAASADSDLSAAQKTKVAARKARFERDVAALRADKKMTDAQKQAKFEGIAHAADSDLMAILTPVQREQVTQRKAINVQFSKDLAALRTNTTMTEAQKKAQFQVMMAARQNALLATLPPAQRARVEREQQVKAAQVASMRRQIEELGNSIQKSESPAQLKQIQAITQRTRAQEQIVVADRSLSDQVKGSRIEALRHSAQMKIDALLTPMQRAQFARLRTLITTPPTQ